MPPRPPPRAARPPSGHRRSGSNTSLSKKNSSGSLKQQQDQDEALRQDSTESADQLEKEVPTTSNPRTSSGVDDDDVALPSIQTVEVEESRQTEIEIEKEPSSTSHHKVQIEPPTEAGLSLLHGTVSGTVSGPPSTAPSVDGSILLEEMNTISNTSTNTTGKSSATTPAEKVVRLSRLVQGLKQKVERLQAENIQLEEMLAAADSAHRGGSTEISRLENTLAREQAARVSAEAAFNSTLAAKESECSSVRQLLQEATSRAATLAEALAATEEQRAAVDAERSLNEGELVATLRAEVEHAEGMYEEERKAHAASRRASAQREHELDASMAEAAASLAGMQRVIEERTAKTSLLEERCLEVERSRDEALERVSSAESKLESALASTAAAAAGAAQEASSPAAQRIGELEAALHAERGAAAVAEASAATFEKEVLQVKSEMEGLRRQLVEAQASDAVDLRRRLQETTDALYSKQAQLERMAADRAAVHLQLERQTSSLSAENLKRRTAAVDRLLGGADDGYGIVPMDSLGDAYNRLANAPLRVGQAVQAGSRFLDSTASQAVRVLRHYPLGRLAAFCYIIGMHLFIYMLLHRLQRRAFAGFDASSVEDHLAAYALTNQTV